MKKNKIKDPFSNNSFILYRDTAGQERFRSLTASFFRDAIGFLLVFDLTNETSFINVRNWIGEIQVNAYAENVKLILVGNKCDLENERIISKARAAEFAKQNHVEYIETSALYDVNVAESVELLLDLVMDQLEQNTPKPNQNAVKILNDQITKELIENSTKPRQNQSYCCSY
jgi:Ras-related protein Rab-27A